MSVRADGGVVVFWHGSDTANRNRGFTRSNNGSGWTGTVVAAWGASGDNVGGHVAMPPAAVDDRIHIAFNNATVGELNVSSTDVVSGGSSIDSTDDTANFTIGPGVIDSADKCYIPYIDVDNEISVGSWASSASPTPASDASVSDFTVKGNGRTVPPFVVACLAVDSTTGVHLLYSRDSSANIYHDDDVDGGGATDVEISGAVTAERISAKVNSDDSAIWYFWKNAGTANVVFDAEALSAFVPSLDAFRYYEDGTEAGATAIDAQDTDISRNVDSDSNLQVRLRVQEQGVGSIGGVSTDDYQLQYDKNVSGFVNVTNTSSNVKAFSSGFLSEGFPTTNRLGAGSGSFVAGEIDKQNGIIADHELTADNFTEHLWSVTLVSADLANGDTLDFRITLNGTEINSDIVPRITATKTITNTPYYYQQLNRMQGVH